MQYHGPVTGEKAGMLHFSGPDPLWKDMKRRLKNLQDNGHPFAYFRLDTIGYRFRTARFCGYLDAGPPVLNGPLVVHGDSGISVPLVGRWIRFLPGRNFSVSVADRVPEVLKSLPFVQSIQPPELEWFGNQAIMHVYLRKRFPNSLNGIVGLLPGQGTDRKLLLTGNLDAAFSNLFNRGMAFSLRWSRFAPASQQAFLALDHPFLTESGMGVSGKFEFIRQDSLYFSRKSSLEILLPMGPNWQVKTGIQLLQSSERSPNEVYSRSQSVSSLVLGIDLPEGPPDRINPGGRSFSLRVVPGYKTRNQTGQKVSFSQLEIRCRAKNVLFHNRKRFWLRGSADVGLTSSSGLLLADQFRIGGLRSLRGFNENQFFSTAHLLLGIQPAWLFESGFLFSFFTESLSFQPDPGLFSFKRLRQVLGFGFSADFEAGPNLIQISIANGWSGNEPPDAASTKIHFGYVTRF